MSQVRFDRNKLLRAGVVFDARLGEINFQADHASQSTQVDVLGKLIACDAQPELVTVSNAGIPSYLANYLDPKLIAVLTSPMKAAEIVGETKKGDWTTLTTQFIVGELEGEVSSYGDYNSNGNADANFNFPVVQSYHYQTWTQWGERELAMAGLAQIDLANQKNLAAALVLNKFQNRSYFFGIDGLQLDGLLNNPALYAPIAPTAQWNLAGTTAEVVYEDIRRLFIQAQTQSNGLLTQSDAMTLALSPTIEVALAKTNQYNVNVSDMLKKNFPNIRIVNAVEYATDSGQLVQLIVDSLEGQPTATTAFTEKMRAHNVVTESSSWKQKKSQGTWGTIIFRPFLIAQMIGV